VQAESCRLDVADEPHDAAALGTAQLSLLAIRHRSGGVRWLRCFYGLDVEQVVEPCQPVPVSRRQEAVVPHFDESGWKHVRQEATDKLFHQEGLSVEGTGLGVFVLKGDVAVFQLQEALVAEGDVEAGWRQVLEGLLAGTDRFGMHDPVPLPGLWGPMRLQRGGFLQGVTELGAEDGGERFDGH
jgi:hypothetical protein